LIVSAPGFPLGFPYWAALGCILFIISRECEVRRAEDIAPAIEALKDRADALIVPSEPLYNTNRIQINSWALRAQLPAIYFDRVYVETGGLMSYGPNWPSLWRRAAEVVDKILRGAKPADIPVEQPRTFELVINPRSAGFLVFSTWCRAANMGKRGRRAAMAIPGLSAKIH
jgi:ABC transporter substrate binding protein